MTGRQLQRLFSLLETRDLRDCPHSVGGISAAPAKQEESPPQGGGGFCLCVSQGFDLAAVRDSSGEQAQLPATSWLILRG